MRQKILIVGSGPAGTAAAFFLSGKDYDITVAERLGPQQYGRYHEICGGGISRKTFRELSLPLYGKLNDVKNVRLMWPDGTVIKMKVDGCVIDRPSFLSSLRKDCESKGVSFEKISVTSIEEHDGGYDVNGTHYDWIVGADGASSIVRKTIFGTKPACKGSATEFIVEKEHTDDFVIRLRDDGSGTYSWEFPHGEKCSTGGMLNICSENEYISHGSRLIPIGGVERISKNKALLIGDAAAMANPVSYGGLRAAFLSAKKASDAIGKNDSECYQKWWDRCILSDRRFMEFNETLRKWSPEEMSRAVRPFRHGGIYLPGIAAIITQPKNINMYFGCLFAFRYGW